MNVTLHQFEQIDSLRSAERRDATRRSHITNQPIRPIMNAAQHQSRLFNALVELLGYQVANRIGNLEEYADKWLADCLIGKIEVIDTEAA